MVKTPQGQEKLSAGVKNARRTARCVSPLIPAYDGAKPVLR